MLAPFFLIIKPYFLHLIIPILIYNLFNNQQHKPQSTYPPLPP
jgi:hypothetical protein